MACYVVIKKGDNKVLDVGNLMSYSMHGNTKVAHVYHPVIDLLPVPSYLILQ